MTAIAVIVPVGLEEVEGNSRSSLPFSDLVDFNIYVGPIRYQQVYGSSAFSRLPTGGAYLTGIFFRGDCTSRESIAVTNLQCNLSTTAVNPDAMNARFADNIGLDDVKVFESARAAFTNFGDPCPAGPSSSAMQLDVPFLYDPAKGNLLMDLRSPGAFPPARGLSFFDSQLAADEVSRVAALSLDATTAQTVDSAGLVTRLEFYEKPGLIVTSETNTIVIKWPYRPDPFQLQWNDSLSSAPNWQNYTGSVALAFGGYKVVKIPAKEAKVRRFYRLFWKSPQPIVPTSSNESAMSGEIR